MIKLSADEAGYSLVEVVVSILLLSIAIIPMVGMFDAGLKSATMSGNYDKARAVANRQLENAKSLPYETVRTSFPDASANLARGNSGQITSTSQTVADPAGFRYTVTKRFLNPNFTNSTMGDQDLMKVTVSVTRPDSSVPYNATGVVAR